MKQLKISLGEKIYDVLVEFRGDVAVVPAPAAPVATPIVKQPVATAPVSAPTPAAAPVKAPAAAPAPAGSIEVRSPMAGKLVSIDTAVGKTVVEGVQVATIEAMKMNTYVFAPKGGTVVAISATPGEAVDENALLLVIQ